MKSEEQLLQSFGEEEYDQILSLTRAVAGSVMGEGEKTWLAYARLKPLMSDAPAQLREILAKRLLDQLQVRLVNRAPDLAERLAPIESGVWAVDKDGEVRDLDIPSIFMAAGHKERLFQYGNTLYVAGVVSDNFMRFLRQQKNAAELTLVIRDFTKMFATMEAYYAYLKKGGRVKVLHSSKLLAVCVNPLAPNGYRLDSDELREAIQTSLGVPAYDVRKMDFN